MTAASDIRYRAMAASDLPRVMDWAASEGWNPGPDDAAAFHATDPEGFFLAEDDGTPVAAISIVNHGEALAFLGLYLCLPSHRGRGIAYGLWQHALKHAADRVVGLDGVPAQQANYARSGFVLTGQTYRYTGHLKAQASDELRPVSPGDGPTLAALDAQANGYAKPAFLRHWLRDTATRRTLVLGGGPRGFATIRACRTGHKIGPVVAETIEDAETLIRGVIALADAGEIMIDVPGDCDPLIAFCEEQGLSVSFNTARMYRGAAPKPGPLLRSISTMELG